MKKQIDKNIWKMQMQEREREKEKEEEKKHLLPGEKKTQNTNAIQFAKTTLQMQLQFGNKLQRK